jgi:hypothetical protein
MSTPATPNPLDEGVLRPNNASVQWLQPFFAMRSDLPDSQLADHEQRIAALEAVAGITPPTPPLGE